MLASPLPRIAITSVVALGCLTLTTMVSFASVGEDVSVLGRWARDDGTTQIRVTQSGPVLLAVNTWVRDPGGREKVGDTLVLKLNESSSSLFRGTAHDLRRDKNYNMTIAISGASMKTTGCILMGLLCKSAFWTRMK